MRRLEEAGWTALELLVVWGRRLFIAALVVGAVGLVVAASRGGGG